MMIHKANVSINTDSPKGTPLQSHAFYRAGMGRLLAGLCTLGMGTVSLFAGDENTVVNEIGMELVLMPAGKFMMGSPESEIRRRSDEPRREVSISRPFYIGRTEVTQMQWIRVMKTEPWKKKTYVRSGPQFPVTGVSWQDASEFCQKLSELSDQGGYRLPTEIQWEYACRGGTSTAYSFGENADRISEYAWIGKNSFQIGERFAHAVAQKKPNPWGLFDMHGNCWEWCSDWYIAVGGVGVAPEGVQKSRRRVVRGGSWHGVAALCRSAQRFSRAPSATLNDTGFRVVMHPKESP